jgi:hypothetical protein
MADELRAQEISGPVKRPILLAHYAPGGSGVITMRLGGEKVTITDVVAAEVYYYAEQDRRTWVWVRTSSSNQGGDYLLGMDDHVHFHMVRSSPL